MTKKLHVHSYQPGTPGGPTLVLLHGFPVDHRMFDSMAEHISARVRVLGIDLPGLGESRGILPPTASMEVSAELVMNSFTPEQGSPVVIAGLSMGGYVAQAIAARYGQEIAGLILLDTRMNADTQGARENRLKIAQQAFESGTSEVVAAMALTTLAASTRQERPEIVEYMQGLIEDQTGGGVSWSQRAMATRPDRSEVIAGLHQEVLVIVGTHDEISPPEVMTQIAHTAQHGLVEIIPDAGHMTPVEQPVAVAQHINTYLDRVVPQAVAAPVTPQS